jgi:hypothetical protein
MIRNYATAYSDRRTRATKSADEISGLRCSLRRRLEHPRGDVH